METFRIDILNPKALNILKDLAELKLIKIQKDDNKSDFTDLVKKLRKQSKNGISFDEITNLVEEVRSSRYGK
jgi:hypothetical protein